MSARWTFSLVRPWKVLKVPIHRRASRIYNAFNRGNERDVQTNITSPDYGKFYNPIQRSIGFVISGSKP